MVNKQRCTARIGKTHVALQEMQTGRAPFPVRLGPAELGAQSTLGLLPSPQQLPSLTAFQPPPATTRTPLVGSAATVRGVAWCAHFMCPIHPVWMPQCCRLQQYKSNSSHHHFIDSPCWIPNLSRAIIAGARCAIACDVACCCNAA